MFSSALKSFSSNINSYYNISQTPTSTSGPWKIYDAKKKGSGRSVSVFILDRRSIDAQANALYRSSSSSLKKANEEVFERLKKEASILARLRHPNILELVEPVEETRNGGLQFVTEAVTHSLSELLQRKNRNEREEANSKNLVLPSSEAFETNNVKDEIELNELEIQKGMEQITKALEFLHENAHLVHGNLTPEAIIINSKYDWKISGLGFSSPPEGSSKTSSITPINISEALNIDARLPQSVQLNLDYCSPDIVLDNKLCTAADMFSLGLLIIALHSSPHTSPLKSKSSVTTYKRLFSSSSTIPSKSNGFLSSRPLPADLTESVLPRLLTRWPAQRMTAKEFQQSKFFNSIPVATIRFLESFPAKTPSEKAQFMRGLSGVISSFSEAVLEKKIITALLEEMKDPELLPLILQNIFRIIGHLTSGSKCFTKKIMPRMKEIFVAAATNKTQLQPDPHKAASLMIVLEHIRTISEKCSAKEFKDYIFPIIKLAIECQAHKVVDASLQSITVFLPALDFTTVKNDLFPIIATVFAKTKSLGIKVRALEAFYILCGGSNDPDVSADDLNSVFNTSTITKQNHSSNILDKYTMQEKIIPLIRAIKTKEPAVAVAALNVLHQVSFVADYEFVALEIFPLLWTMSLGPLLNIKQFQLFMELTKKISNHIETEHTKKLRGLSESNEFKTTVDSNFVSNIHNTGATMTSSLECGAMDFERLVKTIDNESKPFNSIGSGYNNELTSVSQLSFPFIANNFALSIPGSRNTALMTPSSNINSSATVPKLSYFDSLKPTTSNDLESRTQISKISPPIQPQSSVNVSQHRTCGFTNEISQPKIPPEINWDIALASKSKNNLNNSVQRPQVPPNKNLFHQSSDYDTGPKNYCNTLESVKNSRTEMEGNSFSVPSGSIINNHNILTPQNQTQIRILQQPKNPELFPLSPTTQQMPYKMELDKWQSLI
ncbi:Protein kinase domain-containing protein ppk32 [Erysiphe neolycopersici]|uniref:Protein kinase domain-containing protein ppk32 n=1 Tax=Erysiphe neolycopersici TaxID=212602 RepID=A0A420I0Z8_9PEZI|nr:Protein kinase domain-containing protein ppk32 [Erysiphe neolycopersici]